MAETNPLVIQWICEAEWRDLQLSFGLWFSVLSVTSFTYVTLPCLAFSFPTYSCSTFSLYLYKRTYWGQGELKFDSISHCESCGMNVEKGAWMRVERDMEKESAHLVFTPFNLHSLIPLPKCVNTCLKSVKKGCKCHQREKEGQKTFYLFIYIPGYFISL